MNQSTSSTISNAQEFLRGKVGNGDAIWNAAPQTWNGNAAEDSPMIATSQFNDTTNTLNWLVTVIIPASDYYGFMQHDNVYATIVACIGAFGVMLVLILVSLWVTPTLQGLAKAVSCNPHSTAHQSSQHCTPTHNTAHQPSVAATCSINLKCKAVQSIVAPHSTTLHTAHRCIADVWVCSEFICSRG